MVYLSGAVILVMAFYVTIDVVSRRAGGPFSGATDEVSSYLLVMVSTWALAYTLRDGSHVRIEVLVSRLPSRIQAALNTCAVILMGLFSLMVSFQTWQLALTSLEMGAISMTPLGAPQVVPQTFLAIGFSMLFVESVAILGKKLITRSSLPKESQVLNVYIQTKEQP